MKLLTSNQMIGYLPATNEQIGVAIAAFEAINPTLFKIQGKLKEMVDEGWVEPLVVTFNQDPVVVLFVSFPPDNGLWIHAAQALKTTDAKVAFLGAESVMRQRGLKYLRFQTVRRGMVEVAQELGYKIDGLILSKE